MRKGSQFGVPTRPDTDQPVKSHKQARSLKFWIKVEERLYYLCSENKGADQLCGYREAGLRRCFRICKLFVFPCGSPYAFSFLQMSFSTQLYIFA